jgi:hypothetical protein
MLHRRELTVELELAAAREDRLGSALADEMCAWWWVASEWARTARSITFFRPVWKWLLR